MRFSKTFKKLSCLLLTLITLLSVSSTKTYAAGIETWYAGNVYNSTYVFKDCNYTPYKTIGSNGTLSILGSFRRADTSTSQIKLTMNVYDYDTKSLLSSVVIYDQHNDAVNTTQFAAAHVNVHAGQRIQIFVDASSVSNPPGYYRTAWITYSDYIS